MRLSSIITIAIVFLALNFYGQGPDILDYKSISILGVTWESTEKDLIKTFGNPDTLFNPKYECGAYSTDQQDINSVTLFRYSNIDFLIVDNRVVFQDIYFDKESNFELKADNCTLSNNTTIDQLKELFPNSYKNWLTDEHRIFRLWPCQQCDGEIWLHIKNDHIEKVQFWEPC